MIFPMNNNQILALILTLNEIQNQNNQEIKIQMLQEIIILKK